jgi:hypothetical protein
MPPHERGEVRWFGIKYWRFEFGSELAEEACWVEMAVVRQR